MATVKVVKTLKAYPTIDLNKLERKRATKTRPIWAKHVQNILCDNFVLSKLLLSTIEADQMLKSTSIVCRGEAGDVWQQTPEKLLAKYTVTGIDAEGWLVCSPKPDNEVYCYVTSEGGPGTLGFSVIAQWGEKQADGTFLQFGDFGDVVCRSLTDPADVWIVQRQLFDSTYEAK